SPSSRHTHHPSSSPFFLSRSPPPPHPHSFPTRRSSDLEHHVAVEGRVHRPDGARQSVLRHDGEPPRLGPGERRIGRYYGQRRVLDRKSTRLNSSHLGISYAVFCLKKKKKKK